MGKTSPQCGRAESFEQTVCRKFPRCSSCKCPLALSKMPCRIHKLTNPPRVSLFLQQGGESRLGSLAHSSHLRRKMWQAARRRLRTRMQAPLSPGAMPSVPAAGTSVMLLRCQIRGPSMRSKQILLREPVQEDSRMQETCLRRKLPRRRLCTLHQNRQILVPMQEGSSSPPLCGFGLPVRASLRARAQLQETCLRERVPRRSMRRMQTGRKEELPLRQERVQRRGL